MKRHGFTLLEMLVATTIMGIAVVGLLAALSTSLGNAARLTEADRIALLARRQMDALLLDPRLPRFTVFGGEFDRALSGGLPAGWRARLTPFEAPPGAGPGSAALERLELEIWWETAPERRKSFRLEAYRRGIVAADDVIQAAASQP
ncbi:MAG: type II secretion system protein [Bryobacterales bacterium]|nr:type II secretion system GspH family protein [Bryobacteraceae bacterium]MDW8131192.1 type II secretion system protein [Bryobacterales bacterium]